MVFKEHKRKKLMDMGGLKLGSASILGANINANKYWWGEGSTGTPESIGTGLLLGELSSIFPVYQLFPCSFVKKCFHPQE